MKVVKKKEVMDGFPNKRRQIVLQDLYHCFLFSPLYFFVASYLEIVLKLESFLSQLAMCSGVKIEINL